MKIPGIKLCDLHAKNTFSKRVKKIHVHPKYETEIPWEKTKDSSLQNRKFDIAILEIEPFELSDEINVLPGCLYESKAHSFGNKLLAAGLFSNRRGSLALDYNFRQSKFKSLFLFKSGYGQTSLKESAETLELNRPPTTERPKQKRLFKILMDQNKLITTRLTDATKIVSVSKRTRKRHLQENTQFLLKIR